MNGKMEHLNGILEDMISKLLFGKHTKLWDLYLDQALFACRIRTHATTKTSPFYLVYGRQPHLLGDPNQALLIDATLAGHDECILVVQSARQEAVTTTYQRALKAKGIQDEIVTPHSLEEGDWVLV